MTGQGVLDDRVREGREAFERNSWSKAFEALSAADLETPLGPEDLERLAASAWWTGQHAACIDARERAYVAFVEAGATRHAALVALDLMVNNQERGARSVAGGWLKKAIRLLEGEPDCREQGHLAKALGTRALMRGELDDALRYAERALHLGTTFGDRDLQALALDVQGWALVLKGEVDEGMSLLEEATAAAVSGELGAEATGKAFCYMIAVSRDLGDIGRAGEWSEAAHRWCERQAIAGFPGVCRVHQAEVLRLRGSWDRAETEARLARDELINFDVAAAAGALYEIGEIRLRIGDLEAAEDAFRQVRDMAPWPPEPGVSLLLLRRGEPAAAAASIARAIGDEWDPLVRARYLPAQAQIAWARRDATSAEAAATELEATAERYATEVFHAGAAFARGIAAALGGDRAAGMRSLRSAQQRWQRLDVPYESSLARMVLAEVLRADGDLRAAAVELETARATFEKLGARPDADRCTELLEQEPSDVTSRAVRTFMFTDVVGSTALIGVIGDDAWVQLRRWHDQALRESFAAHGGQEVDTAGDGFFVAFPDPASAVACAIDIQRKLDRHRREHGFAPMVRIGLHAAEAVDEGGEYSGHGVHAAARIGALADGGEILASVATLDGLEGIEASAARQAELKGIAEPVEIASIGWTPAA